MSTPDQFGNLPEKFAAAWYGQRPDEVRPYVVRHIAEDIRDILGSVKSLQHTMSLKLARNIEVESGAMQLSAVHAAHGNWGLRFAALEFGRQLTVGDMSPDTDARIVIPAGGITNTERIRMLHNNFAYDESAPEFGPHRRSYEGALRAKIVVDTARRRIRLTQPEKLVVTRGMQAIEHRGSLSDYNDIFVDYPFSLWGQGWTEDAEVVLPMNAPQYVLDISEDDARGGMRVMTVQERAVIQFEDRNPHTLEVDAQRLVFHDARSSFFNEDERFENLKQLYTHLRRINA